MSDTRARLLAAAHEVVRRDGMTGASARVVAAEAGVNQALVFYHFGTVTDLVAEACWAAAEASVATYRDELAEVASFTELLAVGRTLHERERAAGNVAVMAQLMSGAQGEPRLAATARRAMDAWNQEVEAAVRRVLEDSPVADVVDPSGLARAIGAGFIGLELYEGVDAAGADHALLALEQLGGLMEVVDELGPVARRALRSRARRAVSRE